MRPNTRISQRDDIPLSTWAGALTISLALWWGFLSIVLPEPVQAPCQGFTAYTDAYLDCMTGEPLDLTPIQDEAQTNEGNR